MIIEIHGAGFKNKGAELMLRTVVSELKTRLPRLNLAIDPTYGSYESRSRLGLRQMIPPRSKVGRLGFSNRFLRQKLFAASKVEKLLRYFGGIDIYGCTSLSSVQALIDIAGFAYTDQWGSQPTKDFAELTDYYRQHNKPVILLPQAFGPFDKEETKVAFRRVIENANLVFARDRVSYQYAIELASNSDKVMRAPDITLFYPDDISDEIQVNSNYVCIVPNARMLDQGKKQWSKIYESYLIQISREILSQGLQIQIVVHDSSGQDLSIAKRILNQFSSADAVIVNKSDPLVIKEVIGGSLMLVGSRYHSLVASLSKNIPVIALGWSHKYEMLFEDFGVEQFMVSHDTSIEAVLELIKKLSDRDQNLYVRKQIREKLQKMRLENQKMWKLVVEILT